MVNRQVFSLNNLLL